VSDILERFRNLLRVTELVQLMRLSARFIYPVCMHFKWLTSYIAVVSLRKRIVYENEAHPYRTSNLAELHTIAALHGVLDKLRCALPIFSLFPDQLI
jgi:hypothetical protein